MVGQEATPNRADYQRIIGLPLDFDTTVYVDEGGETEVLRDVKHYYEKLKTVRPSACP